METPLRRLFGQTPAFESLKKYALILMEAGEVFRYKGHDLSWPFTSGVDPRRGKA